MNSFSRFIRDRFDKTPFASLLAVSLVFFALGWGVFWFFSHYSFSFSSASTQNSFGVVIPNRLAQTEYPLINPLLFCNVEQSNSSIDTALKTKINNFITDRIAKGVVTDMSVYIQEYGSGKWVGINENERYDPASLLKVPIMIAYYQIAEKTPSFLSEKISFNGDDQNTDEYFKSNNNIIAGNAYSVEELIKSMIVNSDNTALALLSNYVDKNSLFDVYTDLDLPTPPQDPSVQYISAKSYAYFFRILYNATYLNRVDSQKALDLLSQTKFVQGIRGGVPAHIPVADKFGERSVYDQNQTLVNRELHDCGIVYKPGSPYLICIMSKGNNFDNMAQNIQDLSSLVYNDINK